MEERKIARKGKLTFEQWQRTVQFFGLAFDDYVAARQLLMKDLLVQGCVLANTSVEKYFKGIKALLGEPIPHHHDITVGKFINTIKNKFPGTFKLFNLEFLNFLSKSYLLRYLDEIEDDFNLVIIKRKTLAELDYLIAKIEETFEIRHESFDQANSKYKSYKNSNSPLIWEMNYYLQGLDKSNFIKQPDFVQECRKIEYGNMISLAYVTDQIEDDGKFQYEALRTVKSEDGKITFRFCFHPINEEIK